MRCWCEVEVRSVGVKSGTRERFGELGYVRGEEHAPGPGHVSMHFPTAFAHFASCFICSRVQLTWIFSLYVSKHLCIHTDAFTCWNQKKSVTLKQRKKCALGSLHL